MSLRNGTSGRNGFNQQETPVKKTKTEIVRLTKTKFTPWKPTADLEEGFGNEEFLKEAVMVRIAYKTMCLSKEELVAMYSTVDHKSIDAMIDGFNSTSGKFIAFADMLRAAQARMLSAAATCCVNGVKFKGPIAGSKPKRKRAA
jgi:hypothetical protein